MLITPEYLEQQRIMHARPRGYGGGGSRWADQVAALAESLGQVDAILDYGCGQNTLAPVLMSKGFRIRSYDPAVRAFDAEQLRSDLVVCTDVLEHVEEQCVDAFLEHLAQLCRRRLFVVIGLKPTDKTLPDGRQAHITLRPPHVWRQAIEAAGFDFVQWITGQDLAETLKHFGAIFQRKTAA